MRKLTKVSILVVGLVSIPALGFAQMEKKESMGGEIGMMGKKMMMHEMMEKMDKPTIVSSNDGGVIVLTGNKLYKYDKDLNLVKETEIKVDAGAGAAMKMCPMMGKGMKHDAMGEIKEDAVKMEEVKPVETK